MWPSTGASFTPLGRWVSTWPLGPCTTTLLPLTSNFTPCGSGIGLFPIRDILLIPSSAQHKLAARSCAPSARSPHFAQQLAAQALLAGLASSHHSLGRREDVDTQPTQHAGNLVAAHVDPAAGTGDALQIGDRSIVVRTVFQVNAQDFSALFLRRLKVGDVAFFLQNARNLQLQLGSRDIELRVTRMN